MTSFDNSQIRQSTIWKPFEYYGSYNDAQTVERAIIFGLYSNSWRNEDAYTQVIYDIDLANILADYTSKIAQLTVDEQNVVAGITAKRYISEIETLIHDEKMGTQLKKINADSDEWDAKIAALAADRAALETLRVKIASEEKRIAARILVLEAHIQTEKVNLLLADIEISEKEIQLAKANLRLVEKAVEESRKEIAILQAGNEIAKIQLQIVEAGLALIEIDMKVARTNLDIAQTENQIIKAGLSASELEVAKARTEAEEAELNVYESKVDLAGMQVDAINKEISSVQSESTDAATMHTAKLVDMGARQTEKLQSLENQREKALFGIQEREVSAGLDKTITEMEIGAQGTLDSDKMRSQDAHYDAASIAKDAAISAAQTLAIANVASTLTHTIKKKAA